MRRTLMVAVLLAVAALCAPASAHDGCSIHTIAGTWGFGAHGRSVLADPTPDPTTLHLPGLYLPGAFAGRITFKRDGTMSGYYWVNLAGGWVSGLTPAPMAGTVKVNPDCTGEWSYPVQMPEQSTTTTLVERFAIVDGGREIRSISWRTGIPPFTWTLVGRRIPSACRQRRAAGTYAMQCSGHSVAPNPGPGPNPVLLSAASLFRIEVDARGSTRGTILEKVGPQPVEAAFTGTLEVAPDCSVKAEAVVPGLGAVVSVGVMVEGQRSGYVMPMLATAAGATDAAPMVPDSCEIVRVGCTQPVWPHSLCR